jgi:predicted metalloprotease with PDZ domain
MGAAGSGSPALPGRRPVRVPTAGTVAAVIAMACLVSLPALAATTVTCSSPANPKTEATEYFVSLADAASHEAHVSIRLHEADPNPVLEMPVWNALYQVRNFAANIMNVRAQDATGTEISIARGHTSEWQLNVGTGCVLVSYDIHLDTPGPFGTQLNAEHGFFNWAMVLMYVPGLRAKPASIRLLDVPAGWALRDTGVLGAAPAGKVQDAVGVAENYDALVDSPAEAGNFQEYSFEQDGATYHIVVHSDAADYDAAALQDTLKRITHAGVDWMQDRPYREYTFIYHFPRRPTGGGMEHAYGTAIDVTAASGRVNMEGLSDVSAHEFFHLWNVKRIRPQSLEPIDYEHEQETRALWFSEGVTSTVADLLRARSGLIDERQFLSGIAAEITELERRPAHNSQSAEDSSLDAWFEGIGFYRNPERSISYYNKGDVLGVLLDLRIRKLTGGTKSLRDLFQVMNAVYAKRHRYFPDSAGVQSTAENMTHDDFAAFFRDYVAGVKPLPYTELFDFVGLQLVEQTVTVAEPGFTATANLGGEPEVSSVTSGTDASHAGLQVGDRVLEVNGSPASSHLNEELQRLHPGDTVKLRIRRGEKEHTLKLKLGARQDRQYALQDETSVTAQQRAHRAAWMQGVDESGGTQ